MDYIEGGGMHRRYGMYWGGMEYIEGGGMYWCILECIGGVWNTYMYILEVWKVLGYKYIKAPIPGFHIGFFAGGGEK